VTMTAKNMSGKYLFMIVANDTEKDQKYKGINISVHHINPNNGGKTITTIAAQTTNTGR
jgi:gentisate 1,2-dioxygenase